MALGGALMFALVDAALTTLLDPFDQRASSSFGFAFSRLMIPWGIFAMLATGAVALAERFPMRRGRFWRHGAIHAVAAGLFPVLALGGVALYHRLFLGATAPIVDV